MFKEVEKVCVLSCLNHFVPKEVFLTVDGRQGWGAQRRLVVASHPAFVRQFTGKKKNGKTVVWEAIFDFFSIICAGEPRGEEEGGGGGARVWSVSFDTKKRKNHGFFQHAFHDRHAAFAPTRTWRCSGSPPSERTL